ncbi:site-specific integrase [Schinkia azotoformans]|uniref:site-specific integrase n=1 Tax=Schinkia azotoformans TaxID=1454 RepID=UPI002DB89FF3|nr:tyrosine-type recombinase/integrase [Schinkia azotoformans]MEC1744166.1 tyrosine-type recombinase/integrase [Schinkia azotoformans]
MKGHIRKRGNKYAIVVDLGRDHNGKRKQKWFSGYEKKKDAEKDLPRILNEIYQGTFIEPTKEKFSNYLDDWLKIKKNNIKLTTLDTYQRMIKNHIQPGIGHIELSKLNPIHLKKFYNELLEEKELAEASIRKCHTIMQAALNDALTDGFVNRNIASLVKPPRIPKTEIKIWDEEQLNIFLSAVKGDRLYIAFFLAAATGMRRGEVLGVRWRDIDFERKLLSVIQTITAFGTSAETKTLTSRRMIDIDEITISALKKQKKLIAQDKLLAGMEYEDHDLVVCTALGKPMNPRNVNRKFYSVLDKLKIPKIRLHDVRHTHASLLLRHGTPVKVVQERLGHASAKTTLDTYGHLIPGMQSDAAANFSKNVFNEKSVFQNEC